MKILNIVILFFCVLSINAQTVIKTESGEWKATYYGNHYKKPRLMANGEVFNVKAMTCAAPKKFAFGTKLKITNLANNKSVIVTVTDRGGFGNHVIDLTYYAFKRISEHKHGRIKVKVQIIK